MAARCVEALRLSTDLGLIAAGILPLGAGLFESWLGRRVGVARLDRRTSSGGIRSTVGD